MSRGGRRNLTVTSVAVTGMHLPARIRIGTSAHRHESTASRTATNVSTVECGVDAFDVVVAGILAAHRILRFQRPDGGHQPGLGIPPLAQPLTVRRVGHHRGEHLEHMVLHHVTDGPGAVVETPAVGRRRTPRPW